VSHLLLEGGARQELPVQERFQDGR